MTKRRQLAAASTDRVEEEKRHLLLNQKANLLLLPCADQYETSLMHRDVVNHVLVAPYPRDFIITTSIDGHVKFWKKTSGGSGVEFVKHFRACLGLISSVALSWDGSLFACASIDSTLKVFDVINFDMINMFKLSYVPSALCWTYQKGAAVPLLACSSKFSSKAEGGSGESKIYIYDGRGASTALAVISDLHVGTSCHLMVYHPLANVVVSADEKGSLEYWTPSVKVADTDSSSFIINENEEDDEIITGQEEELKLSPKTPLLLKGYTDPDPNWISWKFKSDTDLFAFRKAKSVPTSMVLSPDLSKILFFSFIDRKIRIFSFESAKLFKVYDESLEIAMEMQSKASLANAALLKNAANNNIAEDGEDSQQFIPERKVMDDMEFGRRIAAEREIEKSGLLTGQASTCNAIFDESGNFILVPSMFGVKILNIHTNRQVGLIGKGETLRFINIALYQGAPKKKGVTTVEMAASENVALKESEEVDPTLVCTSFRRNRFYLFTKREPDSSSISTAGGGGGRDIYNEKPTKDDQTTAQSTSLLSKDISTAIIHTTFGDIYVKLFPNSAPKACKNFIEHSKSGYYDQTLFHRVIKSFMIQTGDPLGDGTGGDSIYGKDFEDEFDPSLRHSQPYMLSMANSGPHTNSSQFFITTAATPWLDDKHTIFGKCTGGLDVVHKIETSKVDKHDRPIVKVFVSSIEIREL